MLRHASSIWAGHCDTSDDDTWNMATPSTWLYSAVNMREWNI